MERWIEVLGYESYMVSSLGKIRNSRKQILKPWKARYGYLYVSFSEKGIKKNKSVHSIVMHSFKGLPPEGKEINHKNFNPSDPRLINLEYILLRNNRKSRCIGSKHGKHKLVEAEVIEIRALRDNGASLKFLADKFNVSVPTISMIGRGRIWKHVVSESNHRFCVK